jgi:hypothetical protein
MLRPMRGECWKTVWKTLDVAGILQTGCCNWDWEKIYHPS